MPKRLAVFCDGTWNHLRTDHLTNVARLAKCVKPTAGDGAQQIVFYDEGVGVASDIGRWTDLLVRLLGGGFGRGLDRKVEAAYRFLVLNYEPDDEMFVFGFSRGAYTARSLCGLIRKCGILRRDCLHLIPKAVELYRDERHPRDPALSEFRDKYAHPRSAGVEDDGWVSAKAGPRKRTTLSGDERALFSHHADSYSYRMMYLGLWDTVGSLGIPKNFWFSKGLNRKYGFHDTQLSSLVSSSRHAVALEENRNVFDASPIANIDELNAKWAKRVRPWNVSDAADPHYVPYVYRPYQQVWFPGDHGAVGGGNAEQGLSSATLLWIAEGAAIAGLDFDVEAEGELGAAAQMVNPLANWLIDKHGKPKRGDELSIYGLGGFAWRRGPSLRSELGMTTQLRWCLDASWRPSSLKHCPPPLCPPPGPSSAPAGFPNAEHMPRPACYPGGPDGSGDVRVAMPKIAPRT